jgi:hypothetical protein
MIKGPRRGLEGRRSAPGGKGLVPHMALTPKCLLHLRQSITEDSVPLPVHLRGSGAS